MVLALDVLLSAKKGLRPSADTNTSRSETIFRKTQTKTYISFGFGILCASAQHTVLSSERAQHTATTNDCDSTYEIYCHNANVEKRFI